MVVGRWSIRFAGSLGPTISISSSNSIYTARFAIASASSIYTSRFAIASPLTRRFPAQPSSPDLVAIRIQPGRHPSAELHAGRHNPPSHDSSSAADQAQYPGPLATASENRGTSNSLAMTACRRVIAPMSRSGRLSHSRRVRAPMGLLVRSMTSSKLPFRPRPRRVSVISSVRLAAASRIKYSASCLGAKPTNLRRRVLLSGLEIIQQSSCRHCGRRKLATAETIEASDLEMFQ